MRKVSTIQFHLKLLRVYAWLAGIIMLLAAFGSVNWIYQLTKDPDFIKARADSIRIQQDYRFRNQTGTFRPKGEPTPEQKYPRAYLALQGSVYFCIGVLGILTGIFFRKPRGRRLGLGFAWALCLPIFWLPFEFNNVTSLTALVPFIMIGTGLWAFTVFSHPESKIAILEK